VSTSTSLRTTSGTSPVPPPADAGSSRPPGEPELISRQRAALRELLELVSQRATAEAGASGVRDTNDAKVEAEFARTRQELVEKYVTLDREARDEDARRRRKIIDDAMAGEAKAKGEFAGLSRQIASEFDIHRETARSEHGRARNDAASQLEAGNRRAAGDYKKALKPVQEAGEIADAFGERLAALAGQYAKFKLNPDAPAPARETYTKFDKPVDEVFDRLAKMEPPLKILEGLIIPKSLSGAREAWTFLVPLAACVVLALAMRLELAGIAGLAVTGLVLGLLLRTWLLKLAQMQLERLYKPLSQSLADARGSNAYCKALAEARYGEERKRLAARNDDELKRAKEAHEKAIAAGETARDERLREINDAYARRIVEVQTNQATEMSAAVRDNERRMASIPAESERSLARLDQEYKTLKEQVRSRHEKKWTNLAGRWSEGMKRVTTELAQVAQGVDQIGPAWDDPRWNDRSLPRQVPPVVRFGVVPVALAALPQGVSTDPRLTEGISRRFDLPALRAFPAAANLLIETPAEGRTAALAVLQASMFRILTSLPPGMVRFTIVDPIGIGRNFGAFMHLADYDPALVTNQVWTDPRQIDERLAELEVHMETVTQKYLRNEYASIEAYNVVAGEVAEPYRVLVVADFPTKFDEKSAGRLAAIAAGGVPCGVLVLVAVDMSKALPSGFGLSDLRPYCSHLTWADGRLTWDDPDLARFPLELDPPPPSEFATALIHKIGAAARDAKRVEVPFEFIAPPLAAWWTKDSRAGIDVSLGKSGATKRQNLALGQGTSQHVLIAGRTGSGKSTLMHALITNLALHYSPDEIDLYLIDFKKGVEFKVYAANELPHASVVAIESEREFGISVLQRLDVEMRLRADKFRDAGVQDLAGYRNAPGTPPLPRILLLVDEFQEFFVEEDKLAQEAALLLDRLVRQGRAFGVHVHLGSQSLGGAFTLARSTLGQMAVRIALQCSEVDSLLILAENNMAAKWLSRPGEAIYNDTNGAPEGNHFFQVVWLSDEKREDYLKQIRAMGHERKPALARSPIVFEGDAAAELNKNPLLAQQMALSAWPETPRSALAWLGDAVAIKDPTSALFRRQGGNHLLIVGQNDEAALGVTTAALISLAPQFGPAAPDGRRFGAKFLVLDGTPEDHEQSGVLARLAGLLPHGVRVGGWRDAAEFLAAAAGEVALRQNPDGGDGPELFLFIHDLARFRDLRRREDDFGFGRKEDEATPPDNLDLILRDGPGLGVHVITWCDTLTNLNRYFTHQQLREFEMRVLFQMSPTDSGGLLDSPAASKLGRNRALFSSEEQNRIEKFRPYGVPEQGWLEQLSGQLRNRPAKDNP
jgi:hypothetical protein